MNLNNRKKVLVINSLLIAALFGLVSFNKVVLRPRFVHTPFVNILTGCFPNFIAAYLISLALVIAVLIRKPKSRHLIVYISSIIVFIILMIEELKPMWGASTHYDLYDIIASGLGSGLAILTFEIVVKSRRNKIE